MKEHLKLVREFHDLLSLSQAKQEAVLPLSDIEIIRYQALLMEAGSHVFNAIKVGDIPEILGGLVNLAYVALTAIAVQGQEIVDKPLEWHQGWSLLSVVDILSHKINDCTSGQTDDYSKLYNLCIHLVRGFVSADFDKAFRMLHNKNIDRIKMLGESIYSDADLLRKLKLQHIPDLSDCLYE